jgi:hypothetical protein
MITTALLDLLYFLLHILLSPILGFSDVVLNSSFTSSLATASGYYNSINAILPVDTMLEILGISLAFEGAYLIYKLIMWVIKKIPTID